MISAYFLVVQSAVVRVLNRTAGRFPADCCPVQLYFARKTPFARLRPTYGAVTIIVVSEPRAEQFYVMCLDTAISGPRLIRAWKRRSWIEHCFRTLKHLLATGACQVHSEEAYYGHLVLRLMGCFVLFYTSRVVCKGRLTMEEIIFSLKHYWRFVDCEALELKALSQGVNEKAA